MMMTSEQHATCHDIVGVYLVLETIDISDDDSRQTLKLHEGDVFVIATATLTSKEKLFESFLCTGFESLIVWRDKCITSWWAIGSIYDTRFQNKVKKIT